MKALQDKAVAVIGAGQGLGEAYARPAAEEGAKVVVNDIRFPHREDPHGIGGRCLPP